MSTYMPKEVNRKWYVMDATDKPMGRVAAQAAVLLRGKHKPTFTPHIDCGDHVIIVNVDKMVRNSIVTTPVTWAVSRRLTTKP